MKTVKIKDLVALLQKHSDQNAEVVLEGCDCTGDCVGISLGTEAYEDQVVLRRNDGVFRGELDIVSKVK